MTKLPTKYLIVDEKITKDAIWNFLEFYKATGSTRSTENKPALLDALQIFIVSKGFFVDSIYYVPFQMTVVNKKMYYFPLSLDESPNTSNSGFSSVTFNWKTLTQGVKSGAISHFPSLGSFSTIVNQIITEGILDLQIYR